MREPLFAAFFATLILVGCPENAIAAPRLDQMAAAPPCRRAIDYKSGTFALADVKAKLTIEVGYRIAAIDAIALDTPVLSRVGEELAVDDGFQYNFCLAMGLNRDDPAKRDGLRRHMLANQRRIVCLVTNLQALGARLRLKDVEKCRAAT